VIKRHHLRYHPRIPEVAVTTNKPPTPVATLEASTIEQRQSPSQQQENIAAQSTPMAARLMESEGYQDDLIVLPNATNQLLELNDTIGAFLADMDYGTTSNEMLFSNFGGESNEYLNMDIRILNSPLATSSPSCLSTELYSDRSWRGSTEVSAAKRDQLVKEADGVIAQVSY
jgi:hypothetical protein